MDVAELGGFMESNRINFFKVYGLFYAAFYVAILLDSRPPKDEELFYIAAIVFFPALFVSYFGIKIIQLIKSIPKKHLAYASISALLATGYYFSFAERTYADCILNHVKGSSGEAAVYVIKESCHKKYGYR